MRHEKTISESRIWTPWEEDEIGRKFLSILRGDKPMKVWLKTIHGLHIL